MLSRSRVLAIINPISGVGSKSKIPEKLAAAYSHRPEELFIAYSKDEQHASELVREAVDKGYHSIIAVGGDGSINQVARVLDGSHINLGIIPKGSGNGLARAINIPIDNVDAAIDLITQGHTTRIDTASINGHSFYCTCGVGFDANLTKRYAEAPTRGLITYAYSAVKEYFDSKPQEYRIRIDDTTIETTAFLITVANINQYGNNFYIAPDAKPDDGLLDVVVFRPFHPLKSGVVALQFRTKKIDNNSCVDIYRGSRIVIESNKLELPAQFDGESFMAPGRVEININPRSLNIYTPYPSK